MISDIVPYALAAMGFLIYGLELWSGTAFFGLSKEKMLIERDDNPVQYWLVMLIQTAMIGIAMFIYRGS